LLELIFPFVGVAYLSIVILLEFVHPEPEVMVTSTVPWVVPVQSMVTSGFVAEPEIDPLVTTQLKVCVPGSITEYVSCTGVHTCVEPVMTGWDAAATITSNVHISVKPEASVAV
jgi:hypothetical protein